VLFQRNRSHLGHCVSYATRPVRPSGKKSARYASRQRGSHINRGFDGQAAPQHAHPPLSPHLTGEFRRVP
jgi:hypothetical protein